MEQAFRLSAPATRPPARFAPRSSHPTVSYLPHQPHQPHRLESMLDSQDQYTSAHSVSSQQLRQVYSDLLLPDLNVNEVFLIRPGWLPIIAEFLAKCAWFQTIVRQSNPIFQIIIRTFISDHGRLKVSYGSVNADFTEESILSDMVFSLESRGLHTCELSGNYGEYCQKDGLFKTLSYDEASKQGFTPCFPEVEESWKKRKKQSA